jgi:hypothetical protein
MMKFAYGISLGRAFSSVLLAACLVAVGAVGCGDDDDDTGGNGAGSGGSATGAGGDGAGTGGGSAATGDPKQDTCQCYIDLGIVPDNEDLKAECVSNVSDACITCVEGIAGDATCSGRAEADFNPCVNDCLGLIAPPETGEECKNLIEIFGQSTVDTSVTDCLCDNCLDVFAPCIVNPGCQAIVLCVGERNLGLESIATDEVCGPILEQVLVAYPDALINLAVPVSPCNALHQCRPEPAVADAGVADAGGDGG